MSIMSGNEVVVTFRDGLIKNVKNVQFVECGIQGEMQLNNEIVEVVIPWTSIKHIHSKKG